MVKIPVVGMIDVAKLKTHPNNVKEHPEKQIKNLMQLMKWVGFKDPIVIDKDDNLKAGHGRIIAAERLGMKEVPFVRLEGLTKKQMDLFIYMDNQINESPWIKDNVELLLQDIPMKDLEMFDLQWDGIRKVDYKEEKDPIPPTPTKAKAKLGEIYELGNHRVMCGDYKDHDKLLTQEVDLTITDPPYNIGLDSHTYDNKMNSEEYLKFLTNLFTKIKTITKPKSHVIFTIGHNHISDIFTVCEEVGLHFRHLGVWHNPSRYAGSHPGMWPFSWEAVFDFTNGGFRKLNNKNGVGYSDVWIETSAKDTDHPAEKPQKLWIDLIQLTTKRNELVFDPLLGSGSTLIACEQTNRICYGMEIDPAYIDVIITRFINFKGSDDDVYLIKDNTKVKWRDL